MKRFLRFDTPSAMRAVWCGSTGAIIALIAALNCIPLQSLRYSVSVPIIAAPDRVEALRKELRESEDSDGVQVGEQKLISLRVIKGQATGNKSSKEEVALWSANAQFVCANVPTKESLESSLRTHLPPSTNANPDEETARRLRWAKWQKEVLQHSMVVLRNDRESLSEVESKRDGDDSLPIAKHGNPKEPSGMLGAPIPDKTVASDDSANGSDARMLAPSSDSPFHMASTPLRVDNVRPAEIERELQDELKQIESTLLELTDTRDTSSDSFRGAIAISRSLVVRPIGEKISVEQAIGLMVIGLTSWLTVAWFYIRLARGGGSDPEKVIAWLERIGIPNLGSPMPTFLTPTSDHKNAKTLTAVLEWVVVFLALWITFRFLTDVHWRMLIVSQPLAGLARLFIRL